MPISQTLAIRKIYGRIIVAKKAKRDIPLSVSGRKHYKPLKAKIFRRKKQ
jgi:hypothetical protein